MIKNFFVGVHVVLLDASAWPEVNVYGYNTY